MVADSTEELLGMAEKIGVQKKWIQDEGTYQEHFDICATKKTKALSIGATEVTMKELAKIVAEKLKNSLTKNEL
jgi:hypothetical protein